MWLFFAGHGRRPKKKLYHREPGLDKAMDLQKKPCSPSSPYGHVVHSFCVENKKDSMWPFWFEPVISDLSVKRAFSCENRCRWHSCLTGVCGRMLFRRRSACWSVSGGDWRAEMLSRWIASAAIVEAGEGERFGGDRGCC